MASLPTPALTTNRKSRNAKLHSSSSPRVLPHEKAGMARIRKKAVIVCCCGQLAIVLLIVVTLVALYLTVLRPRPPRVVATVVDTQLSAFRVLPPSLNLSLAVHVTVHNPCHAPFRYAGVVTAVTYRGAAVGRSAAPAGKIPARTTRTVAARVQVDAARVVLSKHYVLDAVAGALPFEAATAVTGRKAAALRPLEVTADAEVACSVVLYPFKRESSSRCTSTVRVTGI